MVKEVSYILFEVLLDLTTKSGLLYTNVFGQLEE